MSKIYTLCILEKEKNKMKKSKLSLGLVTSFIGALALTSCGDEGPSYIYITDSNFSIADFIGYNSTYETLTINTDKFYSEYGNDEAGTTLFYNAVLESLIRYEYKGLSEKYADLEAYSSIEKTANDKVSSQVQIASDNAGSDGDYDEELEKILNSFNVKSLYGLKEHFMYELEKEAITDWYSKKELSTLKEEYLGVNEDWEAIPQSGQEEYNSVFPYHIQHILVKLSGDADDYSRAKITESEAKQLWNVVYKLINGDLYSFEDIAFDESEDGSASSYGDAGIMSTHTSFVNEFKLGTYAYDAILSGVNQNLDKTQEIYEAFGIDSDDKIKVGTEVVDDTHIKYVEKNVTEAIQEEMVDNIKTAVSGFEATDKFEGIARVPYDVFRKLDELADEDEASFKMDSGESVYPRNVIFNQFLNFRSPFIITNEDVDWDALLASTYNDDKPVTTSIHDFENGDLTAKGPNFRTGLIPNFNKQIGGQDVGVLSTSNSDVIIGVKSSYGFHFMVLKKSVFEETNKKSTFSYKDDEGTIQTATKDTVNLEDYYTTDLPGSVSDYPKSSYVEWVATSDSTKYKDRSDTIKNKLKGASDDVFDAAYDYRIYEMLIDEIGEDKITWFDSASGNTVYNNIKDKIAKLRENAFDNNLTTINSSWTDYVKQLKSQNYLRGLDGALISKKSIIDWKVANAKVGDDNPYYGQPGEEATLTQERIDAARKLFQEEGEYYAK